MTNNENQLVCLDKRELKARDHSIFNQNDVFEDHLKKGIYDINYVISVLRMIEKKCEQMKMNPKDLQFTLSTSLKKLICMLEVEREQTNLGK